MTDKATEARKRLDETVNSTKPHSQEHVLARAVREALTLFSDYLDFDYWVEELLKQLKTSEAVPFVVEQDSFSEKDKRKLAPIEHVGPTAPEAPKFQPFDTFDAPVGPEDFGGDDSESHYAAPALWAEIRKEREEHDE